MFVLKHIDLNESISVLGLKNSIFVAKFENRLNYKEEN